MKRRLFFKLFPAIFAVPTIIKNVSGEVAPEFVHTLNSDSCVRLSGSFTKCEFDDLMNIPLSSDCSSSGGIQKIHLQRFSNQVEFELEKEWGSEWEAKLKNMEIPKYKQQ